jgi:hypothetical protein
VCPDIFISGTDYSTRCDVFGLLKVYYIHRFCTGFSFIGFSLFIVLWDIGHVAYLQLLGCKEPPCDGVLAQ